MVWTVVMVVLNFSYFFLFYKVRSSLEYTFDKEVKEICEGFSIPNTVKYEVEREKFEEGCCVMSKRWFIITTVYSNVSSDLDIEEQPVIPF